MRHLIALLLLAAHPASAKPCLVAAGNGCAIKPHRFVANGVRPRRPAPVVLFPDNSVTLTTTTGHVLFLRCLGAGAGRVFLHPGIRSQLIWAIGRENRGGSVDAADRGLDGYDLLARCQQDTDALKAAAAAGKELTVLVDGSGLRVTGESGSVFLGGHARSTLQMQNDDLGPAPADR